MRYFRRGTHRNGALTVAGIQADYNWHVSPKSTGVVVIRSQSTMAVIQRRWTRYAGQIAGIGVQGLAETLGVHA